jgi:hypothetical protein
VKAWKRTRQESSKRGIGLLLGPLAGVVAGAVLAVVSYLKCLRPKA